jgi:tRNA pseudouridine32 synthase / 23S rRNA pseudouridine746 synthase
VDEDPITLLEPQPAAAELPPSLVDPFAAAPHPLARRAAVALQERLRAGLPGVDLSVLERRHGGKMLGVLVVRLADGRAGALRAFSGTLDGRWLVPGFAPPLFDAAARDAFWPAGEAALLALEEQIRRLERAELPGARAGLAELAARVAADRRAGLRVDRSVRAERQGLAARVAALEEQRRSLRRAQIERSQDLLRRLLALYAVPDPRGRTRSLVELFAPVPPPGGAADCAAPKLLALAGRLGLTPLALAEFWWGAVPDAGDRAPGAFYPACRDKCGVVLPYMMGREA